ncbi:MAG: hypothetical protein B6I20_01570 [Bacteroidetes bacterium 4572_117]|nr:MAG: hypothetical protein B6I20_01570 [Bacteroidetes bacterium 4572_117]
MIKKQILEYSQYHRNQFEINFEPAFSTANRDAIHDMRVSIKRLRLLYRFLDFASEKQFYANKKGKLLVEVFKSAGPLRDVQIQLSILGKLKEDLNVDYPELNSFLNSKENSGIEKFKKKGSTFDLIQIKYLFNFSEAIMKIIIEFTDLQVTFDNYILNRLNIIKKTLKKPKQKIDFHRLRKRIKDLIYLYEIKNTNLGKYKEPLDLLKLLGKTLGVWHDIEVFSDKLNNKESKKYLVPKNQFNLNIYLTERKKALIEEFYRQKSEFFN